MKTLKKVYKGIVEGEGDVIRLEKQIRTPCWHANPCTLKTPYKDKQEKIKDR